METLFKPTLDERVSDCMTPTGFDTGPLLEYFGQDLTWRQLFTMDEDKLAAVPGLGKKTADRIRAFISENIPYTFMDFLGGQ
jgi:hypothetical protein